MIRMAAHVASWINEDDPTLGADTSFETVLSEVRQIGFAGLELGATALSARCAAAAASGQGIVAARHHLNLLQNQMADEKARLAPVLEQLRASGVGILCAFEITETIHDSARAPLSERPELPEHLWPAFGSAIEEIAAFAKDYGVKLMYQPHLGTMVQTPAEIAALMQATGPDTGLLFDSAQINYAGGAPEAVFAEHAARIGHIHLGNVRSRVMDFGRANDWPYPAAVRAGVFTVPGDPDGGLDLDRIVRLAQGEGYDCWIVTSAPQDPALYAPLNYQTMAQRHLEKLLCANASGTT